MIKNIRHNIFETNSSSSHSISISDSSDGILDTIVCDDNGVITIIGDGFGREWAAYNDPITKASYCVSDQRDNEAALTILKEVIQEHTGCAIVNLVIDSNSYVDHESAGNSNDAFVDRNTLKRFIFDPKSYVFTGSDETTPPPNFYDVGDVNFTLQLEIDGTDLVFKFEDQPSPADLRDAIDCIMDRHPLNKYCFIYNDEDETQSLDYLPFKMSDISGNIYSSLDKIDQGIIILFNRKSVYEDKTNRFLGYSILETKEVNFRIVPIQK
jgi:hypothetical protein